eukprot:COSAG02_NODE_34406_length_484_cov_1.454545_1_plen_38_part_00
MALGIRKVSSDEEHMPRRIPSTNRDRLCCESAMVNRV